MPILPDDQFEVYLKQFRPLSAERAKFKERTAPRSLPRIVSVWAAVSAIALIMVALAFRSRNRRPDFPGVPGSTAASGQLVNVQPLTIHSANSLLISAPSFESAINQLAIQSKPTPLSKDTRSALSELGKDNLHMERSKL